MCVCVCVCVCVCACHARNLYQYLSNVVTTEDMLNAPLLRYPDDGRLSSLGAVEFSIPGLQPDGVAYGLIWRVQYEENDTTEEYYIPQVGDADHTHRMQQQLPPCLIYITNKMDIVAWSFPSLILLSHFPSCFPSS